MIELMCLKEESEKMESENEQRAEVNKIIPFSNVDGPGNRLAIFFQKCNIHCLYCHNPETINKCINCMECILGCPTNAIKGVDGNIHYDIRTCIECDQCISICKYFSSPRTRSYTTLELFKIVESYRNFIRGITVSGGEPTLEWEFIAELFKMIKWLNLTCFVDTNGFFDKDEIEELIKVTDKFMVDIKAIDKLETLCDCKMKNNLENLKYLLGLNKVYEVRTVIIMDYLDVENTINRVADILKFYPEVIYKLIRVHPTGLDSSHKEMIIEKLPSEEYMRNLEMKVKSLGVNKVELIL
jgi:pyruvate formate lyase activating enzyme